ncbi:MAG: anaerobic ribonucleoside-triphosphate reductase [Candidatus Pacebacteria bacterium]|nr:anaerobic ribonucleoside-triphosphate reductase [Candidatus Paceibacterota bacterium]
MENVKNVQKNEFSCHDCKIGIEVKEGKIENGVMLKYDNEGEIISIFKCTDCYEKNASLSNFNKCEVYSRVVGYLRPVEQWHTGKKEEYSDRREYHSGRGCGCGCS